MMNQRQKAFCEAYAMSGNATEAAKQAGYSPKTSYSIGQRLLKNVEVLDYIRQLREEINAEQIAEVEEIRRFWTDILRDEKSKPKDRLKASEYLGRTFGVFLEQFVVKEREQRAEDDSNETATDKIAMLRDYLTELSEEQLRALAMACENGAFSEGEVIIYIPDNGRDGGGPS